MMGVICPCDEQVGLRNAGMGKAEAGAYLGACRRTKKLTQENVADKLGVVRGSVQNWEYGNTLPEGESLLTLCDLIDADIREVQRLYLGREKPAKPPLHLSSLNDAETLEEFEAIIDARAREDNRALIATVKTGLRWLFGPGGPRG